MDNLFGQFAHFVNSRICWGVRDLKILIAIFTIQMFFVRAGVSQDAQTQSHSRFVQNVNQQIIDEIKSRPKKVSPALEAAVRSFGTTDSIQLFILLKKNSATNISNKHIRVVQHRLPAPIFEVMVDASGLAECLNDTNVLFLQPALRKAVPEQPISGFDLGATSATLAHNKFPAANGKGVVISIKEERFDSSDIDLRNRYFFSAATATRVSGHATIMASMMAGAGNSSTFGRGVAWNATLTSTSYSSLLPESFDYYKQNNISIQNHSYGVGIESEYGVDGAAYDLSTWQDSTLLHIFSAGNAGTGTATIGNYKGLSGWANITGSFKMSKNSLSVAALDSFNHVELLSSRGPAYDGRIKPELSTFGEDGTSGAAALTSGTAALLQQTITAQLGGKRAPASLVKAILINSTEDVNKEGPDFISGYGRLNVYRALQIANSRSFSTGQLVQGSRQKILIEVPANVSRIAVTLCWSDSSGNPAANAAIQNNLDLSIIDPKGNVMLPWILNPSPHPDSLSKAAVRGVDNLNVVEHFSMLQPPPGNYEIWVDAKQLSTFKQAFSLAWHTTEKEILTFTNPTNIHPVNSTEGIVIRWNQSFPEGQTGDLDFIQIPTGTTTRLQQALPLSNAYLKWKPTATNTGKGLLRMTIGSSLFYSDTFLIHAPVNQKVGFVCEDSLLLYWPKTNNASSYIVYNLSDTFLMNIGQTSDTFFTVAKNKLKTEWLSVSPVIQNKTGAIGYTFNYNLQGTGCYVKSFLADLDESKVNLTLSLGTLFGIQQIIFQKRENNIYKNLSTQSPSGITTFSYIDNQLITGANQYRAAITLANGSVLYTTLESVYFTGNQSFIVFPNPLSVGQELKIISRYSDIAYATLFDAMGRKILTATLDDLINPIKTKHLQRGVYFLQIHNGKEVLQHQKIVLQ